MTSGFWPWRGEFLEGDAPLALEADIDDGEVVIDADDPAGDDGAGEAGVGAERRVEQGGEIFDPRVGARLVAVAM